MVTIWKYTLDYYSTTDKTFEMPRDATVLHVEHERLGSIQDVVSIWIEVDTAREKGPRRFVVVGTGHEVPQPSHYVGTVLDSPLVLHVFEVPA